MTRITAALTILGLVLAASIVPAPRSGSLPSFPVTDEGRTGAPHGVVVLAPAPKRGEVPDPRHELQFEAGTGGAPLAAVTRQGYVSFVSSKYGRGYLALPYPRGTRARICGAGGCITRTSNDYGPSQRIHPDRIADLSAADFPKVCGVSTRYGLCPATLTILRRGSGPLPRPVRRAIPTAPTTDTMP